MTHAAGDRPECWPGLPLSSWKETYATVHMWTQIVGKVRLRLTPLVNHWWNVPLYVTARGLTTSRIPYGERAFELWFDFVQHQLVLQTNHGLVKTRALEPDQDRVHASYDRASVDKFWRILLSVDTVFNEFRAARYTFSGEVSTLRSRGFPGAGQRSGLARM
jgi:hypothetical protein